MVRLERSRVRLSSLRVLLSRPGVEHVAREAKEAG